MENKEKIENMKKLENIINDKDLIYERLRNDKKVTYKTLNKMILECPIFEKTDYEELEYTKEEIAEIEKDEKEILILCMKLVDKVSDIETNKADKILKEIFKINKDNIKEMQKDEKIQKIINDLLDNLFN